jgi:hypothetical protein
MAGSIAQKTPQLGIEIKRCDETVCYSHDASSRLLQRINQQLQLEHK